MARSAYVQERLRQLGAAPARAPRMPSARTPRQRKNVPEPARRALEYVVATRAKDWRRGATWFDVDNAFQAGFKAGKSAQASDQ